MTTLWRLENLILCILYDYSFELAINISNIWILRLGVNANQEVLFAFSKCSCTSSSTASELDYLTWVLWSLTRLGNTAYLSSPSVTQALGLEVAFIYPSHPWSVYLLGYHQRLKALVGEFKTGH